MAGVSSHPNPPTGASAVSNASALNGELGATESAASKAERATAGRGAATGAGGQAARVYGAVVSVLMLLGVVFRLQGGVLDPVGLWGDEAVWAERLLTKPLEELFIRPIGFMWLSKQATVIVGPTEVGLRLIPLIGGLVTLGLSPFVANALFRQRVTKLLFVAIIALHPALVDMSKEFKPYAFETAVHAGLLLSYLAYRSSGKTRYLVGTLVALPFCFLFAYNVVFFYPGVFLIAFFDALRRERPLVSAGVVVSALCCLAVLGSVYFGVLQKVSTPKTAGFWSKKYDVFYRAPKPKAVRKSVSARQSQVVWTAEKYMDMAAFAGKVRDPWDFRKPDIDRSVLSPRVTREIRGMDLVFWSVLHVIGLWYIVRRRSYLAFLLWMPLLTIVGLNVLAKWPLGGFRTNTFILMHTTAIGLIGMERIMGLAPRSARRRAFPWLPLGVLLLTIAPNFLFDFHPREQKRWWATNFFPYEIATVLEQNLDKAPKSSRGGRQLLLIDPYGYPLRYYMKRDVAFSARYRSFFKRNFRIKRAGRLKRAVPSELRRQGKPIWLLVSKAGTIDGVRTAMRKTTKVLFEQELEGQHLLMLVASKSGRR